MPIIAKATTDFKPAPPGTHAGVCCDVIDLGELEVNYSGKTSTKHKVRVVWQIEENREDGKPFTVRKQYTLSLHEKASLRKDLESWRGRPFTELELEGFDLEDLLGAPVLLNVIHEHRNGQTYANVATLMRLPKSMMAPSIHDYIRVCERTPEAAVESQEEGMRITDDDIPF